MQNYVVDKDGQYWFGDYKMLVSYIRGEWRQKKNPLYNGSDNSTQPPYWREFYPGPIGVVIAIYDGEQIRYGYSRTNTKAGDKFQRNRAIDMALGRALNKNILPPFDLVSECPRIVRPDLERLYGRTKNYFKFLTAPQSDSAKPADSTES